MIGRHSSAPVRMYERPLPGSGFVAIDVERVFSLLHGTSWHGELRVERRDAARRIGHEPPVIATVDGPTAESVIAQLLPLAQSNHQVGAGILRVTGAHRAQP